MKKLYIAMALAVLPFSSAHALSISVVDGNPTGYLSGASILYDFESGSAPSNLAGDFTIYPIPSGTSLSAAPAFDESNYFLSVPNPLSNGLATLTFTNDMGYLGLYWGSVDEYNQVRFYNDNVLVGTVFGTDVSNPANGNQTAAQTNRYVNITGVIFDKVEFASTKYAFEIDNIAVNPVPEPATMLLFGAGLAGLAGSRLRRKK
jgi:hypothetical protein